MGQLKNKTDYENLRKACILENQARLAALGLHKTISDLRTLVSSAKSGKTQKRKWTKKVYETTSLRRSDRLKRGHVTSSVSSTHKSLHLRRSNRLKAKSGQPVSLKGVENVDIDDRSEEESLEEDKRPANAPLVKIKGMELQLSPEASAQRCNGNGRGTIYDPIFGICCHFCRQKTLCGEEDCKRCGHRDPDQPCIGKTDCSVCHSTNGVLCRACLKVRYGEEIDEVREKKEWMCPHCIEERGINPYWICNSSFCLRKRKLVPTGIAIYKAREMGYKSVAHLLMNELQQKKQPYQFMKMSAMINI